jgi:TBC1 domain family member 15
MKQKTKKLLKVSGIYVLCLLNSYFSRNSYQTIKNFWYDVTLSPGGSRELDLRKARIIKDVLRTDRNVPFYGRAFGSAEASLDFTDLDSKIDNESSMMLKDILLSYCYYNPRLEYVQGMSDLLSPILYVMKEEALSFWMFANWMAHMVPPLIILAH